MQLLHKVYHSSMSMYVNVYYSIKISQSLEAVSIGECPGNLQRAGRDQDVQFSQKGLPDGCRGLPYSAMCNDDGRIDS